MQVNYQEIIEKKYLPELFFNNKDEPRHVGIEIEYSNLSLEKSAKLISEIFGGNLEKITKYELKLKDTKYGDFKFELDAQLLQKMQTDNLFDKLSNIIGSVSHSIDDIVDKTSKRFVPFEIATPPIPIKDLKEADKLVESLRLNGALGTTHSLYYAFGVHFNIEPPSQNIEDVLRLFKSFLIIQKWIELQSEVDIARKVSPYINDFPKEYIKKIIDLDYKPTKEEFLQDYIKYNPTRNRILDMLPQLAFWDEEEVRKHLPKEKINPRPTYHYRLPNSKVNLFRWNLSQEFQLWVIVEILANNEKVFNKMSKEFLIQLDSPLFNKNEWIEQCHGYITDLL
ncbi:amidoligase family protein [Arcobacter sp. KX21116]|uniref:amidoligase family protein n=1 Tax=Arcobacter iocasae TaxID=2906515 RepID=UPI0035D4291D